jgi:hypothetical protein
VYVQAQYFGLLSNAIFQSYSSNQVNASLLGQYLLVNQTSQPDKYPNSTLSASFSVVEITDDQALVLNPAVVVPNASPAGSFLSGGNTKITVYNLSNTVSPNIVFAGILTVNTTGATKGSFFITSLRPPASVIYTSNAYAQNILNAHLISSVTIQRYVSIGRANYVAYLTVWRTST